MPDTVVGRHVKRGADERSRDADAERGAYSRGLLRTTSYSYVGYHQDTDESRVQRNIRQLARLTGISAADINTDAIRRAMGGAS